MILEIDQLGCGSKVHHQRKRFGSCILCKLIKDGWLSASKAHDTLFIISHCRKDHFTSQETGFEKVVLYISSILKLVQENERVGILKVLFNKGICVNNVFCHAHHHRECQQ